MPRSTKKYILFHGRFLKCVRNTLAKVKTEANKLAGPYFQRDTPNKAVCWRGNEKDGYVSAHFGEPLLSIEVTE